MIDSDPLWSADNDWSMPVWRDYRTLLRQLESAAFPDAGQLSRLLPPETINFQGLPIRFVPGSELVPVQYEAHIYRSGEVSTRERNWHDLFNALVWCRLPRLKAAMNAVHFRNLDTSHDGRRGPRRDALTLFDESGVIVLGQDRDALKALAQRDWSAAFRSQDSAWDSSMRLIVCGHALLEKFLNPYKSITAHALLLHSDRLLGADDLLESVDSELAGLLLTDQLLESPKGLSPLPLMGIPGWWPAGDQDNAFYDDPDVFRVPAGAFIPGPIVDL